MILDAEVLLIDTQTSKPLPFGTLGIHKVPSCPLLLKSPPRLFSSDQISLPVPPESSFPGRQRLPLCIRLYLLQRHKPHGEVSARETNKQPGQIESLASVFALQSHQFCSLLQAAVRTQEVPERQHGRRSQQDLVLGDEACDGTSRQRCGSHSGLYERHVITCGLLRQRAADLADMITRVIREGLEGLVLKDVKVPTLPPCWFHTFTCDIWPLLCARACMNQGNATG